jgi:RND superfamily putative drug exporter
VSLRHPRRALAIALVVIAALVIAGVGLEDRLSPSTLDIRDTPVHRANELLGRHFGDSAPFVILLRGPAAAIDRQGPELIRALRRDPEVTTLSPWDRGLVGRLRPAPRRALIIADYHVGIDEAVDERVPLLDRTLDEKVRAPVRATQSGFATLSRSIQEESIAASERGEAIALPILLIVLLLVFRSPLAAAIPLGFGVLAVLASRGLLAILTTWFEVSALALTVCTMMGLALGVDYALLLVSRFREELASGASPIDAAWTTRRTAGRTTVFAGSTLALSMLVALFVVPGALLASLAGTLALVVVLNVLIATFVGPPLLVLMGANIERWPIGRPGAGRSKLMAVVSVALRRPGPVAAAIALVVLILAAPALALKTGPFSVGQLSRDDPVRRDYEIVQKSFPGFEAPFVIVAATGEGAITEPARLRALTRFQRRIAAIPGVQSVVGPGQFSKAVEPLREAGSDLLSADDGTGPGATLDRLGHNLGRVAGGVAALRAGVSQATYGAGLLAAGSGSSEAGAAALVRGLGGAIAGTREAVDVIDGFARGSRRLRNAQSRASVGALALKFGIRDLIPNLRRNALVLSRKLQESLGEEYGSRLPLLTGPALVTEQKLEVALQRLEGMTDQRADPDYAAVLDAVRAALAALSGTDPVSGQSYAPDYAGLPTELPALQARLRGDAEDSARVTSWLLTADIGLKRLAGLAKRLSDGLTKITTASTRLSRAAATLDREAGRLSSGVGRLGSGATELASGLGRLTDATAELERRLGGAYRRSRPLQAGLGRARVRVLSQGDAVDRRVGNLRRLTPGIFDSGYFVLSALDGTRGRLRERGVEAVDLDRGGQAATLTVFSRFGFNSAGSLALNERLEDEAAALGAAANLTTGVAGGPPTLNTYGRVTKDRLPYVVAAITLVTLLVLILVLRAIPLAAIAVGLNLATVGVAFGVLTLLTHVPGGWPLGGRGYVDAVGATMIFGVVFGLSIDYAVFLLVRMRDHYDREGDSAAAVAFGLEKTAGVITGAAAIMMAVFIAFAGAPVATVSQLGIGLTVAVLLDATVVRIVLLPALMLLLGDRAWWLPRPVERLLPKLEI